jgi:hypothetical protein
LFQAYAERALAAGYDVHMGRKLRAHLERSGFAVVKMKLLRDVCGPDFDQVQAEFLDCLKRADHTSVAKVHCCIGNLL